MAIVFEKSLISYEPNAERILDEYFVGRRFDSLTEAFSQEDKNGHELGEFFEPETVSRTLRVTELPANYDPVNKVKILWKQVEDYGRFRINLPGVPVLTARVVD